MTKSENNIINLKEIKELKKELKSKINSSFFSSSEVVEISQKIDKYIVQVMKELNSDDD